MEEWLNNVRRVTPYTPGEQPDTPGMIKLNTNENPYPPSPAVEEAICGMDADRLRLYPDPAASRLVKAIAGEKKLLPEQVYVGVGSDDVLAMCFLTFFNGPKPIFFPDITYSFYDVWARMLGIPYETKALDENFAIVPADYEPENGGVVIANPNAPTGLECPSRDLEAIVKANQDVIVIIDEAYVDFGARTALPMLNRYDNLIVVQTFSKSRSLAGMRIGYACASPRLIRYLNDVKYSFNSYTMNQTAILAGVASLLDRPYFEEMISRIVMTRERTKERLAELGFSFCDSRANFLFATHKSVPAKEIYEALRERDIYVRYFDKPRIDNYIRITIGTDGEMEFFFSALREYLESRGKTD